MKLHVFFCFLLYLCPVLKAQTDGDLLFDQTYMHEIRFESETMDILIAMINDWQNNFLDPPYRMVNVRVDGNLIDSIGVRIKGGLSSFDVQKPLKIDFNEFVDEKNYDGVLKLNLQNASNDKSLQREALAYDIFRQAGVKCSRTAFAKVYINNSYQGVYTMLEQVDKNFLRNYFADDEGTLYKKLDEMEIRSGSPTFQYYQELVEIRDNLNGQPFQSALDTVMATDPFLRYFLIENFINAVDNPVQVDYNYYLYHEPKSSLLYWIPWDFNLAFYSGANYPLINNNSGSLLYRKMLEQPGYLMQYLKIACYTMDYLLTPDYLHDKINTNAALIREVLVTDPNYLPYLAAFDLETQGLITYITNKRLLFESNLQSLSVNCPTLQSPVDFQGIVINEFVASSDSNGISDPAGGFPDWIELFNNTNASVPLEGFYLSHDKDFLKHWAFPPGLNIDSQAYLIIWADKDVDEDGLHTDFKLDKEGGKLFLSYENHQIVDSVTYSMQTKNIAAARIPNGIGSFITQEPTFAQYNGTSYLQKEAHDPLLWSISPNPGSDQIKVTFQGYTPQIPVQAFLVNTLGCQVMSQFLSLSDNIINLQSLQSGVYYLVIEIGNQRHFKKVIKN